MGYARIKFPPCHFVVQGRPPSTARVLLTRCYRSAAACAVVRARVNSKCNSHTREAWSVA